MKQTKKIFLLFLIFSALTIIGCQKQSINLDETRVAFDKFTDELFVDQVKHDSITLNYTLMSPEDYGITDFKPTLGEYSMEEMKKNLVEIENMQATLSSFPYKELTEDQKLTYDILKYCFELDLAFGDTLLFTEDLSPTIGIQAQLPILLAEYRFYNKNDLDKYIGLLESTYDYFNNILLFEQEKAEAGLFMSDSAVDAIVSQCNSFLNDSEENLLISVFEDRLKEINGLTKSEMEDYKIKNKEAVKNYVIPAYEVLIDGLKELTGSGTNEGGLCNFPQGKQHYENLVKQETGSVKSINELIKLLDESINENLVRLQTIAVKNPDAFEAMVNVSYEMTNPEEIMDYLKEAVKDDYPELKEVNYSIKYVHESLEDNLSPAFYLKPCLDNYVENSVYINGSDRFDLSSIFTTIAHEGYPGHLYQNVYFNQKDTSLIRNVLHFGGYSEGWATYVEMSSYYLAGLDNDVASMLEKYNAATLALYSRIDIGVNYEGWNLAETADYLKSTFGISDKSIVKEIYQTMILEPGNYLQYSVGYLELVELRNKAEKALLDKFNLKEFHRFFLDIGPAPFSIISERMDNWVKEQSKS